MFFIVQKKRMRFLDIDAYVAQVVLNIFSPNLYLHQ